MIKKLIPFIVLFFISLVYLGCADDPTSVGLNQLPPGDIASLKTVNTDSLVQTSFFYKDSVSFYKSDRLILGRNGIAQSSILMKFNLNSLADSSNDFISKVIIKSARVFLKTDYSVGSGDLPFLAYKISDFWTVYFNADSLAKKSSSFNQEVSVPGSFTYSDSLISFELNPDLVLSWMKAEKDSTLPVQEGIYLKDVLSTGQNRAAGFSRTEGVSLKVIYDTQVIHSDTLTYNLARDVHVVSQNGDFYQASSGYLYLQGGLSVNAFLKFYFPTIPKNAIVNYASLEIPYDTTKSSLDENNLGLISVNYNISDSADFAAGKDSVNGLNYLKNSKPGWFIGDITSFVSEWFNSNSSLSNKGLKLSFTDENRTLDLIALITDKKSAEYGGIKPRIKIYYSVP